MTMTTHVSKVCSKAFRGSYSIRNIRKYLSEESTKILIHAFVTSHLNYCNSLLKGIPQYQIDRLQRVLNAAAGVTCRVPRFDRITPTLIKLHWLPTKVALLIYKALNGISPSYLTELFQVKAAGRYALRTNNHLLLQVPRTKCSTFGDRSLVAVPKIWNGLPLDIKQSTSVDCFKSTLKTFLFRLVYEQSWAGFLWGIFPVVFHISIHIIFNTVKLFRILCNVSAI